MLNHRHVCLRWKIREISARSLSGGMTGRVNVSRTDPLLSRSFSRRDRSRSLNDRGFVYDPQLAIALRSSANSPERRFASSRSGISGMRWRTDCGWRRLGSMWSHRSRRSIFRCQTFSGLHSSLAERWRRRLRRRTGCPCLEQGGRAMAGEFGRASQRLRGVPPAGGDDFDERRDGQAEQ